MQPKPDEIREMLSAIRLALRQDQQARPAQLAFFNEDSYLSYLWNLPCQGRTIGQAIEALSGCIPIMVSAQHLPALLLQYDQQRAISMAAQKEFLLQLAKSVENDARWDSLLATCIQISIGTVE